MTRKTVLAPPWHRPCHWTQHLALLLLVVLVALGSGGRSAWAAAPPWEEAPYSHYAQGQTLQQTLQDFAQSFSLVLAMDPDLQGKVHGRFNTRSPGEFLNKLASVYGFQWFTHAGTLYISSHHAQRTVLVPVTSAGHDQLRTALTRLGVIDARFGWGELAERGVVMVSGPPAYVDLVERTLKMLPSAVGGQQVAVYRLKYASVDDRVVQFRDREIQTPGLMSILRSLVRDGGPVPPSVGIQQAALAALAAPLRSNPPVVVEAAPAGPVGAPGPPRTVDPVPVSVSTTPPESRSRTPSIQGDVRTNSLIIQDFPERLTLYERLLRALDVPTALIEVQALIADVNSQRMQELGIQWGARVGQGAIGFGDPQAATGAGTIALNWAAVAGGVNPSTLVVDTANFLATRIRALESLGDASVRSTPSVLTLDNQGALFDFSQTFYVRVQGERVANLTPVTAGTTLRVTPRVIDSGGQQQVQLVVDIEDGKILQDATVDALPTVQRSGISTQAVVNPHQTMVIGGYQNEQEVESTSRVPVLGEIPVLGALFTHKTTSRQKRERLFFIKPVIVSLPPPVVDSKPAPP